MNTSTSAPQPSTVRVKTAKVKGRRRLRFATLDELLAESERLASGPVRQLGNWPVGQCFGHLSRAMKMSLEGGPGRAPWWMRWTIGKMFKPLILSRGMRPGFTLPALVAEILVPAPTVSAAEALHELRSYVRRLQTEPQRFPHPVFGNLTRNEWDRLHMRHAEMHLSFYVPE
jgi:hypothetical protein